MISNEATVALAVAVASGAYTIGRTMMFVGEWKERARRRNAPSASNDQELRMQVKLDELKERLYEQIEKDVDGVNAKLADWQKEREAIHARVSTISERVARIEASHG